MRFFFETDTIKKQMDSNEPMSRDWLGRIFIDLGKKTIKIIKLSIPMMIGRWNLDNDELQRIELTADQLEITIDCMFDIVYHDEPFSMDEIRERLNFMTINALIAITSYWNISDTIIQYNQTGDFNNISDAQDPRGCIRVFMCLIGGDDWLKQLLENTDSRDIIKEILYSNRIPRTSHHITLSCEYGFNKLLVELLNDSNIRFDQKELLVIADNNHQKKIVKTLFTKYDFGYHDTITLSCKYGFKKIFFKLRFTENYALKILHITLNHDQKDIFKIILQRYDYNHLELMTCLKQIVDYRIHSPGCIRLLLDELYSKNIKPLSESELQYVVESSLIIDIQLTKQFITRNNTTEKNSTIQYLCRNYIINRHLIERKHELLMWMMDNNTLDIQLYMSYIVGISYKTALLIFQHTPLTCDQLKCALIESIKENCHGGMDNMEILVWLLGQTKVTVEHLSAIEEVIVFGTLYLDINHIFTLLDIVLQYIDIVEMAIKIAFVHNKHDILNWLILKRYKMANG